MNDLPHISEEDRLKVMIEGELKEEVGDSTIEEMRNRVTVFLSKKYGRKNV